MRHAVMMAGGSGTRLWPLSRSDRPKQLLRLFEGKSLLRWSYERLAGLLPAGQIHVIAGRAYLSQIAAELPELPPENLIGEPVARDTAAAVGLAAHVLARRDPDGTMGVFTADHIIRPLDRFCAVVERGFEAAERHPDALVTFGITPTGAHTGYGYIHRGGAVDEHAFEVRAFKEKPDQPTAEQYLHSGEYLWNSGMFAWRIATIIDQFGRHQPQLAAIMREVAALLDDPQQAETARQRFAEAKKISVDYAILEKAGRVLCVPMDCEWFDVGSWTALAEILPADAAGNVNVATQVLTLDARGNIIVSEDDHLIAALGIEDMVIVRSVDATLICRRQDAQRVKELADLVARRQEDTR